MNTLRRFTGFVVSPGFVQPEQRERVAIAFDHSNLTQWSDEPARVWQTPLSEVRDLSVTVGREVRVGATIAGVRYTWRTRRGPEHDELIETIRARGGRVVRSRRGFAWTAGSVAAVVVIASAVSVSISLTRTTPVVYHPPSAATLLADQFQKTDFPPSWHSSTTPLLANVIGSPGEVTRKFTPVKLTGTLKKINDNLVRNYESCAGISQRADRLYGEAGQVPVVQVNSKDFASSTNLKAAGYTELMSSLQWYGPLQRVQDDTAQYRSLSKFGSCLALNEAQTFNAIAAGTAPAANTQVVTEPFTIHELEHAFVRAGVAPVAVTINGVHFSVIAAFASVGHYELYLDCITTNVATAKTVVAAALGSELAKLALKG